MRTVRVLAAAGLAALALTGLAPAAMAGPVPGQAARADCTPPALRTDPGFVGPFAVVGVVQNGADQTPVVGAPVTLVDGKNVQHVTKTIDCGYFFFQSNTDANEFVAPGLETVTVSADGFEPLTQAQVMDGPPRQVWQFLLQALPVQTSASPSPSLTPLPQRTDHTRLILIASAAGGGGLLLLVPTLLLARRARRRKGSRSAPPHVGPAVPEQLSVVTRSGGALAPAVRAPGPDFQLSLQPRMQPGVPQVMELPR
jgi:hypothetical protein